MLKHTNPFYTITEGATALKNVGANPLANPFKYDESCVHWQDHIMSTNTYRVYNDHYEYHFEMEIHIDRAGFDALVQMTGLATLREPHSDGYDTLSVRPGALLKVFTLVAKEATIV